MAEWSIAALRTILSTETDTGGSLNTELMSQIRENLEAILMLVFYTGDSGTATSDPPNDTTGVLTDTGASYAADEHNGRVLVIKDGNAKGNIYQIDDTTSTTIVCTGDNLYADGVRSGDAYMIFFDIKNTAGHDHDGINSDNVVLADESVGTEKLEPFTAGIYSLATGSGTTSSTSGVIIAQFKVGRSGSIRMRYGIQASSGAYVSYGACYKNSVQQGSTGSTSSTSMVYTNIDVTVDKGDILDFRISVNNVGNTCTGSIEIATGNPTDVGADYNY